MNTQVLIVMLLAAITVATPLNASAQYSRDTVHWGLISSIIGNDINLEDGTTVVMREGTIIDPVGKPLYPGMVVRVKGQPFGRRYIDAHIIDKVGAQH
jgi:hypothetical protein